MSKESDISAGQGNPWQSVAKNAAYQFGGRLSISAGRFAVAILLIRYTGAERYGEYSLILSLLIIAEWLVDFGITDIGVRNISQQPDRQRVLLRAIAFISGGQAIIAFFLMLFAFYAMGYPQHIVRAGLLGGVGLIFYAGIVVYRILFRVKMSMEKNVLGEATGLLVMLPLVVYACFQDATVEVFIGCYLVARIVHFFVVAMLGRGALQSDSPGADTAMVRQMLYQAVPLGVAGLLVCFHESMIPVMLSKMTGMEAVGEYSYTLRFAMLIIMVIQSLNIAFFPLLSSYWKSDKEKFWQTQQIALEASILIGAGLFCLMNASAEFILTLAGAQLADAVLVLRLMSWLVLLRIVTMPITPLIIVAGGQVSVLWIAALSMIFQFLTLLWLVPVYGTVGAVIASLLVKLVIGTLPIILISGRMTGYPLKWKTPVKILLCAVTALFVCELVFGLGSLWVGALCFGLYWVFATGIGALSRNRIQFIYTALRRRRGLAE